MSLTKLPFEKANSSELKLIYKDTGVDEKKLKNSLKLIKEWLKCESYLPKEIDDNLLANFVLGCKGNLEKTKEKLEQYLIAKTKLSYIYHNRVITDEVFSPNSVHRSFYISPKLTSDGYRVLITRIVDNASTFDFSEFVRYYLLMTDVLLAHDICSGYHIVYELGLFSPQHLPKMNLTSVKHLAEVLFKILPLRIKSIKILNDSPAVQVALGVCKLFMTKKLKERITYIKLDELLNFFSKESLPVEFGGIGGKFNDNSDEIVNVLKRNGDWLKKSEGPKLIGPIPESKKKLYSFEDFSMEGSFRQLSID